MRTKNEVFLHYLANAFHAGMATLAFTDSMIGAGIEAGLRKTLRSYREEVEKRTRSLDAIIRKRGGQRPAVGMSAPGWATGSQAAAFSTIYERMLSDVTTILRLEQAQTAFFVGLAEMARALGDSDAEKSLIADMSGCVKMIERFQGLLPSAIKSAFASGELAKSAQR